MLVAAVGIFLPWQSGVGDDAVTAAGNQLSEGRVGLIVALATVMLVQFGWRPAWIGAGFVTVVSGRILLDAAGSEILSTGAGVWVSTLSALVAVALLVWDMFAGVSATARRGDLTGSG